MKWRGWPAVGVALLVAGVCEGSSAPGSLLMVPVHFASADGETAAGENGLFVVPENRRAADSRPIAIRFIRFPAALVREGRARAPVMLLPGGPGSEFDFSDGEVLRQVRRLSRTRDVVYVSQRGNPKAPGLGPDLRFAGVPAPLDRADDIAAQRSRDRESISAALERAGSYGVDASAYDILNAVDDVHDLRKALGYDKVVLRGCSFGSQWSLAYLRRWPETVDRALLSGVEPLDYAYDSPKWIWAAAQRVAKEAEADSQLAAKIPGGGLLEALKAVIRHLEQHVERVTIEDPSRRRSVAVSVGAEDLRQHMVDADSLLGHGVARRGLANWPRFILEMRAGDYRYLAALALEHRRAPGSDSLVYPLIDNSLGITSARDAKLRSEPEARWLGDINAFYHNTRDLTPTPVVSDDFRLNGTTDVPVVLMNGDFDWSTPIENAQTLRLQLKHGHLLQVHGGTHCMEDEDMRQSVGGPLEKMYEFLDADFEKTPVDEVLRALPESASYPPIQFAVPGSQSMYDEWVKERVAHAS